jgi:hypothetical protein
LHADLSETLVVDKSLPLREEKVFTFVKWCSSTCKISTIYLHVSSDSCKLMDEKHC